MSSPYGLVPKPQQDHFVVPVVGLEPTLPSGALLYSWLSKRANSMAICAYNITLFQF
jgi:hypothetical protein